MFANQKYVSPYPKWSEPKLSVPLQGNSCVGVASRTYTVHQLSWCVQIPSVSIRFCCFQTLFGLLQNTRAQAIKTLTFLHRSPLQIVSFSTPFRDTFFPGFQRRVLPRYPLIDSESMIGSSFTPPKTNTFWTPKKLMEFAYYRFFFPFSIQFGVPF